MSWIGTNRCPAVARLHSVDVSQMIYLGNVHVVHVLGRKGRVIPLGTVKGS
jgi:hypothetical protein